MSPPAAAAARHPGNADARDILDRITRLRGGAGTGPVASRDVLES
ncbi:hypothetical protein AB0F52_10795 [Amycolatopsis sp. NPDC024027]